MVSLPVNPNALSNHYNPRRTRLFVANLNKSITVADVKNCFKRFGEVIDVRKPKNSVACVDFQTKFMANSAMAATGKNCNIKGIQVELSRKMPGAAGAAGAPAQAQAPSPWPIYTAQPGKKQTATELDLIPTGAGGNSLRVGLSQRIGAGPGRGGATPRLGAGEMFTRRVPESFRSPFEQTSISSFERTSMGDFMNVNSDNFSRNRNLFGNSLASDVVPSVQSTIQTLMKENLKLRTTVPSAKQELDRMLIQNMRRLQQENEEYTKKLTSFERDNDTLRETLAMANESLVKTQQQNALDAMNKELALQMANESMIKTQQQNALDAMNKDLVSSLSLAEMLQQSAATYSPMQLQQELQQEQRKPVISRPGMKPMQRQKNVQGAIKNRLDIPVHTRLGGVQKRLGGQLQMKRATVQNVRNAFSNFNNAGSWQ